MTAPRLTRASFAEARASLVAKRTAAGISTVLPVESDEVVPIPFVTRPT